MRKVGWAESVVIALHLCAAACFAQNEPWNGLYRITGGIFTACCGIAAVPSISRLPNSSQAYVRLRVDRRTNLAQMSFLQPDMQTVVTVYYPGYASGFGLSFSNGVICPGGADPFGPPGWIRFGGVLVDPCLGLPVGSEGYTVHYQETTLRIDGACTAPCEGCSDIPTHFTHSNVTAILTGPIIDNIDNRSNELRFHFNGEPPYYYMVEFASSTSNWQFLGMYRALTTNISVTVTNSFTNAATRFFRVRMQRENIISGEGG